MRDESILDDALEALKAVKRFGHKKLSKNVSANTCDKKYATAIKEQSKHSVLLRRRLAPAKIEITLDRHLNVVDASHSRHLEDSSMALDHDVVTPVILVRESNMSFFETIEGVRMPLHDPLGTLGMSKELDSAMQSWLNAFTKAVEDSRSRLSWSASSEFRIEWPGELRLTPQGQVFWKPGENPDYSSIEDLCTATIAVWSVMED